jgi:hypothetical protein
MNDRRTQFVDNSKLGWIDHDLFWLWSILLSPIFHYRKFGVLTPDRPPHFGDGLERSDHHQRCCHFPDFGYPSAFSSSKAIVYPLAAQA